MKTLRNVIAINIRSFRVDLNWSQANLAHYSGLTCAAICQIENKKRTPSIDSLFSIAQALEVGLDDLVKINTQQNKEGAE